MESKRRINNYGEFIKYYRQKEQEYNDIERDLEELKRGINRLNPKLIVKRRELKAYKKDLEEELAAMEDFASNSLRFEKSVEIEFMKAFYSEYFGYTLKAIEIYDKKDSKYAVKATVLVSERDARLLDKKFDLTRSVNSKDFYDVCQDEIIYLKGSKKVEFYDGVSLSSVYKDFPEIDQVLQRTLTYKIQNPKVGNVECLEEALNQYLNVGDLGREFTATEEPMDVDVSETLRQNIQKIMDEKDQSSKRVLSMVDEVMGAETVQEAPKATEAVSAEKTPSVLLAFLENPMESLSPRRVEKAEMETKIVQTQLGAVKVSVPKKRVRRNIQPETPEQVTPTVETAKTETIQTGLGSVTRVVNTEKAPEEKRTQYQAASSVVLDMLDGIIRAEDNDRSLKKRP